MNKTRQEFSLSLSHIYIQHIDLRSGYTLRRLI